MHVREPTAMEQDWFRVCCEHVLSWEDAAGGIGTLGEKTVHAVMKRYLEPEAHFHEKLVGDYVVDIGYDREIVEIQTANFDRLRRKIDAYLPEYRLRIVYPVPATKWLCWYDPETGEEVSRRRSPKKGRPADILRELYRIRPWLLEPGLSFEMYFIDMEEHRLLDGYARKRKKGSTRVDRIPLALRRVAEAHRPEDWLALIPDDLDEPFTSRQLRRAASLTEKQAFVLLRILRDAGLVDVPGKDGRAYLYERTVG